MQPMVRNSCNASASFGLRWFICLRALCALPFCTLVMLPGQGSIQGIEAKVQAAISFIVRVPAFLFFTDDSQDLRLPWTQCKPSLLETISFAQACWACGKGPRGRSVAVKVLASRMYTFSILFLCKLCLGHPSIQVVSNPFGRLFNGQWELFLQADS